MGFFTHLNSSVPCTISINGLKTYNTNTHLLDWVDIYSKNDFFISFLPKQSDTYSPVTTKILSTSTDGILKIPYINNHYEVVYQPNKILQSKNDVVLLEKNIGELYITIISNEKTFITVSTPANQLLCKTIPDLINITTELANYFIIKGITKKNTYYVLILNLSNNSVVVENEFNIIEEDSKEIKLLSFVNDFAKHGVVYKFDKKSMVVDTYSVYQDNKPKITDNINLIPYAFLESIKYKDFALSKYYLKDNFISNEHITSYFGEIKGIYFNTYNTNLINYTILSNEFKSFNFEVKYGKITDIDQVKF